MTETPSEMIERRARAIDPKAFRDWDTWFDWLMRNRDLTKEEAVRRTDQFYGADLEKARNAARRLAASDAAAGVVSVPAEATDEMLNAAQECLCDFSAATHFVDHIEAAKFMAMLAASPYAPVKPEARDAGVVQASRNGN